uniref:Tetraspanin n=1 Tax=Heterorhabditis bacteriophora TaxID=37862 RepID=A0A1I7WZW4_HETBA
MCSKHLCLPDVLFITTTNVIGTILILCMATPRRQEQLSCCSLPFLRHIMLFFGLLTIICGALFLALSAYLFLLKSDIIPLLHNDIYLYCIYLMTGCGILILTNGFLSCSAVSNKCVIVMYGTLLLLIVFLEGVLGYSALSYSEIAELDISANLLNDVRINYAIDPVITRAIDRIQLEGRCCGAHGFNDYPKDTTEITDDDDVLQKQVQYIPDTCCRNYKPGCGKSDHPSNIYYAVSIYIFRTYKIIISNFKCSQYFGFSGLSTIYTERDTSKYVFYMHSSTGIFYCSGSLSIEIEKSFSITYFFQSFVTIITCCVCLRSDGEEDLHPLKDRDQEMSLFE